VVEDFSAGRKIFRNFAASFSEKKYGGAAPLLLLIVV
jgi:hypothetical protein